MIGLDRETLIKMIDHTQLNPQAGEKEISKLCSEARHFGFHSVCVNSCHTRYAVEKLKNSGVQVCTVVDFPLGAGSSAAKVCEARNAIENGAAEIDMVINIGALRDKKADWVAADIRSVVDASHPALVKVILETCYLTDEEIVTGCELAIASGARFVKTSTGFGAFGAFPVHVRLMRQTVGPKFGVKAAGGIRHFRDAWRLIQAGASRLGLSASVTIIDELAYCKTIPTVWLEDKIPCRSCPSRFASLDKQTKAVYAYYKNKCLTCPYYEEFKKSCQSR